MAAAAYVLLPVSGLLALALGRSARVRAHGAQAIAFGLAWPVMLFGASAIARPATIVVLVAGAALYVGLIGATLLGRDPLLPVFARYGRSDED